MVAPLRRLPDKTLPNSIGIALIVALLPASFHVALAQAPVHEMGERQESEIRSPEPAQVVDPRSLATPDGFPAHVRVNAFRFSGAHLIGAEELASEVAQYAGRKDSAADLHKAAQAIANAYVNRGFLARVRIAGVSVAEGIVDVAIEELIVGKVVVDIPDGTRISSTVIEQFLTGRLVPGKPVPLSSLEAGVTALNAQPGIAAAVALDPGARNDEVDVVVRLRDRPVLSGRVFLDNHGLREIGQERLGGTLRANNAFGLAERLTVDVEESRGNHLIQPGFSLPLGSDGARIGADTTHAHYRALRAGADSRLTGSFDAWRAFIQQPIVRNARYGITGDYAYLSTAYRGDSIFGQLNDRKVRSLRVGISGFMRSADSITRAGVEIDRGAASLAGNADDLMIDSFSTKVDGAYWRLRWRLSDERPLGIGTLVLRANGQWANRNLDSTQQFALGGDTGVRAFPTSEALGDGGWIGTAEWRYPFAESFSARAFVDTGSIERNAKPWGDQRNRFDLSGFGAGLTWRLPERFRFDLDAARRLGGNPDRGLDGKDSDGRDSNWRLWLALSRDF
jgi:hemolysin activation/secretion protein